MIERTIAQIITKKKLTVSVAESCTGGLVSHSLTNIPGSSKYFMLGIVAYSNESKQKLVGVSEETLRKHGAVSKETALELARNIKHIAGTNIGIGITGIAGPSGGTPTKPVGTVFISVSIGHHDFFKKFQFSGKREIVKKKTKDAALNLLNECLHW
ncbi:MAG TPA: CinA family protein [Candidatus Omnitrophota bacterium]|nr:CinA family protein [Candidatus Omnitrophota bacterium]